VQGKGARAMKEKIVKALGIIRDALEFEDEGQRRLEGENRSPNME